MFSDSNLLTFDGDEFNVYGVPNTPIIDSHVTLKLWLGELSTSDWDVNYGTIYLSPTEARKIARMFLNAADKAEGNE